jgi:hypothetical protein
VPDDHTNAVIAHGLLNSMAAIVGALETIERINGPEAPAAELVAIAKRQARFVMDGLRDLVMGLPDDARRMLDELSSNEHRPD